MKQTLINCLLLTLVCLSAVGQKKAIGGNKDKNGCLSSAGYQWSSLKKECIRSFEVELQLTNRLKTFNCAVIFSKNKQIAEIFSKEGVFLMKSKNNKKDKYYAENGWILEKKKNSWIITSKNNLIIYQKLS